MNNDSDNALYEIGLQRYEELRPRLIDEHRGDAIFIDCRSGKFVIQRKNETRFDAEARLLKICPNAHVYMDHIAAEDFTYRLPSMTAN